MPLKLLFFGPVFNFSYTGGGGGGGGGLVPWRGVEL